jgi:ATP-dependent Clp protease ATP-binding subunit ClpC
MLADPDHWTPAARDACTRAADEARGLAHDYVGTEHVLLALVSGDDLTADVLRDLGVTRDRMLATSCMQPGHGEPARDRCLAVMPRLKQGLERSRQIADDLDVDAAGTEHLLAGVVAIQDSMAVEILRRLRVRPDGVRAALAERLAVDPQRLGTVRRRRWHSFRR